jgi:hypothetical protein
MRSYLQNNQSKMDAQVKSACLQSTKNKKTKQKNPSRVQTSVLPKKTPKG